MPSLYCDKYHKLLQMLFNIFKNSAVYGSLSLISLTAGTSNSAKNGNFILMCVFTPITIVSSVSTIVICAATRNPYSIGMSAFFYTAGYSYNHHCMNK